MEYSDFVFYHMRFIKIKNDDSINLLKCTKIITNFLLNKRISVFHGGEEGGYIYKYHCKLSNHIELKLECFKIP